MFTDNEPCKKKDAVGWFNVTMRSYNRVEICELAAIYILSRLLTIIDKNVCGLYRDDGLLVLLNVNGQQIDHVRKNVVQLFKDIGFFIHIETNLKIVNFLDITFSLNNSTFKPYKKPTDSLLYIKKVKVFTLTHSGNKK